MTGKNEPIADSVSRRTVLRKGTATGALVIAGTAASGSAAAQGSAIARASEYQRKVPFTVILGGIPIDIPASCNSGRSAEKEWLDFGIEYDNNIVSGMAVRGNKVEAGERYEFTSQGKECKDPDSEIEPVVQTAFKPVND